MHESHLVERLVLQALEAAQKNKAARITRILMVVGKQSGIDPESVRLHFSQLAAGTIAERAELVFKRAGKDSSDFYIEDIEVEQ